MTRNDFADMLIDLRLADAKIEISYGEFIECI